jgi:ABC-type multidrug transport system fused ATPase/permease subunit
MAKFLEVVKAQPALKPSIVHSCHLYISFIQPLKLLSFILLLSSKSIFFSFIFLYFFYIIYFFDKQLSFFLLFLLSFLFFLLSVLIFFCSKRTHARMHERCIREFDNNNKEKRSSAQYNNNVLDIRTRRR